MTKVQAVEKLIKAKGGKATWEQIYNGIEKFYPDAKASQFWQEGIRGVVYREMRYGYIIVLRPHLQVRWQRSY
jgi:hypothetical protein